MNRTLGNTTGGDFLQRGREAPLTPRSWLAALNDIAGRLASLHQSDDLLREVTAQARRLLGVDLAYIGLVQGDEFVMEVASGALTPQLLGLRIPRTAGIAGEVVTLGEPVWASDYSAAHSFSHLPAADLVADAENIRALLGVPLTLRGEVIGALFACKRQERHFTDDEIALLSALASHAAIALDNTATLRRHQATAERLNAANAELERTLRWDRQLTHVVLRGGGVDDLMREVAAVTTGEVLFVDAHAGVPEAVLRRAPGLPALVVSLLAEPNEATAGDGSVLVRAVIAGRTALGALILLDPRESDQLLLERAAPALALIIVGERAVAEASRLTRDALLVDLLTRPDADPAALRQRIRGLGLDPAARYHVLVALPLDGIARARRELDVLPAGSVIAAYGTQLIAVTPAENLENLLDGTVSATVGVAGPASEPSGLAACYRDAADTANALLTLGKEGRVSTAAQLGVYRVLLNHTGRAELRAQYDRLLGAVVQAQNRRKVPLLRTLQSYLDSGRRLAQTAEALGIHVNTLYQRLAHLDELLGASWREPPRALDLQILLRVTPPPE